VNTSCRAVAFDAMQHRRSGDPLGAQQLDDGAVEWLAGVVVGVANIDGELRRFDDGSFGHCAPPNRRLTTRPQ
jgi:hypothetical protein